MNYPFKRELFILYIKGGRKLLVKSRPLADDASPGEVGALDAEAAVLQRFRQRVPQRDLCSHLAFLLWFPNDLYRRTTTQPGEAKTLKKKCFCRCSHWTHPDFDLRILQNNVPHCQRGLDGAVVYQQSCQADQVVLSEQAAILGVVQPERNSPLFKGHAKCVNRRPTTIKK